MNHKRVQHKIPMTPLRPCLLDFNDNSETYED